MYIYECSVRGFPEVDINLPVEDTAQEFVAGVSTDTFDSENFSAGMIPNLATCVGWAARGGVTCLRDQWTERLGDIP